MALGVDTIAQGLATGVTGNINKAYVLMHRPELIPSQDDMTGKKNLGSLTGLSAAAAKLQDENYAASGNVFNALSVDKTLADKVNQANYILVPVQFNPASIAFQGMGGEIRRESVGGSGENQFQQFDTPSETILAMELIFDDTNNKDAFMMDAEMPLLSEITSVGGLTQRIEQGVNALQGKKYSVQDQTELFIGAMVQNFTRLVGFAWNKMIFWGELVGVNVQYTMFNKAGAPIRAKVAIQIRQDQAISGEPSYQTEKNWEKAFENLFESR